MIGVTFAIGKGWKECGDVARFQMEKMTGVPCVLIDQWPDWEGLPEVPVPMKPGMPFNPSWLKLWAQENFPGEDLLIFDSDIVSCKPWDPVAMLDGYDFVFAREYVHQPLYREARELDFDPFRYGNCGLMIIKADCKVLEEARQHFPEYGTWLEQTAVNKVLQEHPEVRVRLLPRAYNRLWPTSEGIPHLHRAGQTNLHFCALRGNAQKLRIYQRQMIGSL